MRPRSAGAASPPVQQGQASWLTLATSSGLWCAFQSLEVIHTSLRCTLPSLKTLANVFPISGCMQESRLTAGMRTWQLRHDVCEGPCFDPELMEFASLLEAEQHSMLLSSQGRRSGLPGSEHREHGHNVMAHLVSIDVSTVNVPAGERALSECEVKTGGGHPALASGTQIQPMTSRQAWSATINLDTQQGVQNMCMLC